MQEDQEEQEDYQNAFGNFEFPSQQSNGNDDYSNFEDPFAQFIPSPQRLNSITSTQNDSSVVDDPFAQFIPKEHPQIDVPNKSILDKIVDPIISGGEAASKGLRHAISAPSQFINPFIDLVAGTNFTGDLNAANKRLDEEYRLRHPNAGITEQTISNVTEGLPAILFGGASVPGLSSKGISGLSNLALSGAASAPLIYDESGGLNPLTKTAIGAGAGAGAYGLGRLASLPVKAFNKLAGEISEPELREIMKANQGLKTGIGDIIQSPKLKKFQENVLSHVPFSGVEKTQIQTAKKLTDEGNNMLNNFLGEEDKKTLSEGGLIDVGSTLQKSLKSLEEVLNKEKRELYSDVDKIAEESGIKVNATNYQNEAKSILNNMKSSREFGKLQNTDKEAFENFLKDISTGNVGLKSLKPTKGSTSINYKNEKLPTSGVDSLTGIFPITTKVISSSSRKYPKQSRTLEQVLTGTYPEKQGISGSVKSANLKISDLNDSATQEFVASNKFLGGAYNRLKKALQKDLRSSIESSGNKELSDSFAKAQKHYAENIAPFEDKDILKFTRKGSDTDTLVNHFIKSGKSDRGNLLGKLVDKLSPEERNILAYDYFRPAFKDGLNGKEMMPRKMVQLYNKLGDKTKEKLFTPEFRKQMKTYGIRVKTNSSSFDAMYNPKTGAQLASLLPAAEIAAAITNPSLAPSLMATSASANLLNRGLNSEWLRNLYLKGYNPLRNISPIEGGLSAYAQDIKNQY